MLSGVVEVAAWIIVAKAVSQWIMLIRNDRRQRIEKRAVIAEYDELARAEYKYETDKTLTESGRERMLGQQRERQRLLQMRYPQYLIPSPDSQYVSKAIKADNERADRVTWKDRRLTLYVFLVVGLLLFLGMVTFAHFSQWLKEFQF
jgi:hypothetical protein